MAYPDPALSFLLSPRALAQALQLFRHTVAPSSCTYRVLQKEILPRSGSGIIFPRVAEGKF